MKKRILTSLAAFALAFGVVGCSEQKPTETTQTSLGGNASGQIDQAQSESEYDATLANKQLEQKSGEDAGVPSGTISVAGRKPKEGEEVAVLETTEGNIVLMFFPDKAPKHVENFKKLVKQGFYDGTKFHRAIKGFMIQGGDPNTKSSDRSMWGMGGPDHRVKAEFNDIHHAKGVLSMARSSDPDSAGSQFFIMVGDAPHLNHQYTAFGKVVTGQDVADKIVAKPSENEMALDPATITKARLAKWPVK